METMQEETKYPSVQYLSAGIIPQIYPFFAEGWKEKCFELGVIKRGRSIKTPEELMLLCLFHLINGCSLMEISEIGRLLKIGKFSDVAFMGSGPASN